MTNKQTIADSLMRAATPLVEFTEQMARLGVQVVQPDEMVPSIYYMDQRRFFPIVDEDSHVVGGNFG